MAARLRALRDDHVDAGTHRPLSGGHRAHLINHRDARRMRARDVGGRVAPEEGQERHPFLDAHAHEVVRGEGEPRPVEERVHPERPVGEPPQAADLLAQHGRRVPVERHDAEAAGVTDGRRKLGSGDHAERGAENGHLDAEQLAESRSQHGSGYTTCRPSGGWSTPTVQTIMAFSGAWHTASMRCPSGSTTNAA